MDAVRYYREIGRYQDLFYENLKTQYHIYMFKRRSGCDEPLLATATMLDAVMNETAIKIANRRECRPVDSRRKYMATLYRDPLIIIRFENGDSSHCQQTAWSEPK
jgi:hypothetical protein